METCDGLVVEEATFDQWLVSAFVATRRAVPKAKLPASQPTARPHRRQRHLVGGARVLYWLWLAGALLALAIH